MWTEDCEKQDVILKEVTCTDLSAVKRKHSLALIWAENEQALLRVRSQNIDNKKNPNLLTIFTKVLHILATVNLIKSGVGKMVDTSKSKPDLEDIKPKKYFHSLQSRFPETHEGALPGDTGRQPHSSC